MINIYVADLKAYNEGNLVGEWIELPTDEESIREVLKKLSHNWQHDYAIHDYEAPRGVRIEEYTDPFRLNTLVQELEDYDLGEEELEALLEYAGSLEEAVRMLSQDAVHFIHLKNDSLDSWAALAEELVYEYDWLEIPEYLRTYIDYEKLGKELQTTGNFYIAQNGVAIEYVE